VHRLSVCSLNLHFHINLTKCVDIDDSDVLRTGDRALVAFKFLYRSEYIKPGMRLVFREGRCKGLGLIEDVFETKAQFDEFLQNSKIPKPAIVGKAEQADHPERTT
jgi:hypothetical protein